MNIFVHFYLLSPVSTVPCLLLLPVSLSLLSLLSPVTPLPCLPVSPLTPLPCLSRCDDCLSRGGGASSRC